MLNKAALVLGATRGIGKQIALTLGENGYRVCVAAKTVEATEKSPGTIHDVVYEIVEKGGEAFAIQCDVRSLEDVGKTVDACLTNFGQLDLAVYNAGAILWNTVAKTPFKRFDLMNQVNARGAYAMVDRVLPHMLERKSGRIIVVAPPIYNRFFKGKTPYAMTKIPMTVLVHGLGMELEGTGVSISAIWPAAGIESQVTKVQHIKPEFLRKPTIFADACLRIAEEKTEKLNGKALVDEDYLRSEGVTDFTKYRCDPSKEPPRMLPKEFPSLLVAEENLDPTFTIKSKM